MIGTSGAARTTADALLGGGVAHLPHLADYNIFGAAKTTGEPFSADGDIDGDGISNGDEYDQVVAVGGNAEVAAQAIMDPLNLWPGNPALPVVGAAGLALLAGALAFAGLRRK
jgi:hypothetical protein